MYENELDKVCFQHAMTFGEFKDLPRRTASIKVLLDKEFNIAQNPKYDGYRRGLASMIYKYFRQKSTEWIFIRKYKICKVYVFFKDKIWCRFSCHAINN